MGRRLDASLLYATPRTHVCVPKLDLPIVVKTPEVFGLGCQQRRSLTPQSEIIAG
jgi:hypothetical protein